MAISKNLTLNNGLVINNAYIRIDTLGGSKNLLGISVKSYLSKSDYTDDKEFLEEKFYNFVPSVMDTATNFIKQGYEYLKTLEEYKDAVDLLDETTTP